MLQRWKVHSCEPPPAYPPAAPHAECRHSPTPGRNPRNGPASDGMSIMAGAAPMASSHEASELMSLLGISS